MPAFALICDGRPGLWQRLPAGSDPLSLSAPSNIGRRAKGTLRLQVDSRPRSHWLHKAYSLPKEQFKHEVEKHLTGKDSEPAEIILLQLYKSQIPVIEQAIETAGLMLGSDKSRGYCPEMICVDFLAGANLDSGNPNVLLTSISRFFKFLPPFQQKAFLESLELAS